MYFTQKCIFENIEEWVSDAFWIWFINYFSNFVWNFQEIWNYVGIYIIWKKLWSYRKNMILSGDFLYFNLIIKTNPKYPKHIPSKNTSFCFLKILKFSKSTLFFSKILFSFKKQTSPIPVISHLSPTTVFSVGQNYYTISYDSYLPAKPLFVTLSASHLFLFFSTLRWSQPFAPWLFLPPSMILLFFSPSPWNSNPYLLRTK